MGCESACNKSDNARSRRHPCRICCAQRHFFDKRRATVRALSDLLQRIAAIAERQRGLVTTAQLERLGIERSTISRWARDGRLHRVHNGVFSLSPVLAPLAKELAAVLACGDGAVVSHRSAAVLWRMLPADGGDVDVTVTGTATRQRAGIRVHRTKHPPRTMRKDGIPITTPQQTLLDLAPTDHLDHALNEAFALRLTTPNQIASLVAQSTTRPGTRRLKEALTEPPGYTESAAEEHLRALIKKAGLPPAEHNAKIEGYRVDAVWRTQRLIVEVDGFATHGRRDTFERDRKKDADLMANGWRVMRTTWRQLTREPEGTAVTLARALYASAP
jgi:very-short-patch-repair endonuclease